MEGAPGAKGRALKTPVLPSSRPINWGDRGTGRRLLVPLPLMKAINRVRNSHSQVNKNLEESVLGPQCFENNKILMSEAAARLLPHSLATSVCRGAPVLGWGGRGTRQWRKQGALPHVGSP